MGSKIAALLVRTETLSSFIFTSSHRRLLHKSLEVFLAGEFYCGRFQFYETWKLIVWLDEMDRYLFFLAVDYKCLKCSVKLAYCGCLGSYPYNKKWLRHRTSDSLSKPELEKAISSDDKSTIIIRMILILIQMEMKFGNNHERRTSPICFNLVYYKK